MKEEYEIVLVEDNPNDAELTLRCLKKNRLANKIIVLEDGEQALDFFFSKSIKRDNNFHRFNIIVFLDIKLPKVDGLEVLKQLKSNEKTRKIPVIMVTSSNEDPDIATAYDFGANSYVVKPIDYDQFVETINKLELYWLVINEYTKG